MIQAWDEFAENDCRPTSFHEYAFYHHLKALPDKLHVSYRKQDREGLGTFTLCTLIKTEPTKIISPSIISLSNNIMSLLGYDTKCRSIHGRGESWYAEKCLFLIVKHHSIPAEGTLTNYGPLDGNSKGDTFQKSNSRNKWDRRTAQEVEIINFIIIQWASCQKNTVRLVRNTALNIIWRTNE